MLHTTKMGFYILISGMIAGAYLVHHYESEHIRGLTIRGFCGGEDVDKNFFWRDCVDPGYAQAIAKASVDYDRETAAVLADMNKPKGKRK